MRQQLRHQAWIVLAAGLVLFTNLGIPQLWDEDEPRNASCAREMMERGDWVVPTFNYELRTDKPVLVYWLMMTAYRAFGVTEFAARFWSALLATGTCLCTYHLGRRLFRPEVGLWAGLILASSLMFGVAGRAATPDSTLLFFATLSLLLWISRVQGSGFGEEKKEKGAKDPAAWLPATWIGFAGMYAAMGLAVLAKGPVGALFPVAIIGLFLLCVAGTRLGRDAAGSDVEAAGFVARLRRFVVLFGQATWAMRPLTLLLVAAAVAFPWYVLVGLRTDGEWLKGFFGDHNLGRFSRPMEGHSGPVFFYIPAILIGFFPWSVFLPLGIFELVKRVRSGHASRPAYTLLACWAGLYVGVFSLAGTKLPSYVLPAYPALALITGCLLADWAASPAVIGRWWLRGAYAWVALAGTVLLIGLPLAAAQLLPGESLLGLIGLIPLVGAGTAWWCAERAQARRAVAVFAVMAVALSTGLFGLAAVRVGKHQTSASLVGLANRTAPGRARIATFQYSSSSVIYYAGAPVVRCKDPQDVGQFFADADWPFLIVDAARLDQLKEVLPADSRVLAREPRFLKQDTEVVLIGRPTNLATRNDRTPDLKF